MTNIRLIAVLMTTLLLLSACSGGGDAATDDATESTAMSDEATSAEDPEPESAIEATDEAPQSDATTVPTPDATPDALTEAPVVGSDGAAEPTQAAAAVETNEELCVELETVLEAVGQDNSEPAEIESSFASIDEALGNALDVAPDSAIETIEGTRAFFSGVNDAAVEVDYDDTQIPDEVFASLEAEHGEDVADLENYFTACELNI